MDEIINDNVNENENLNEIEEISTDESESVGTVSSNRFDASVDRKSVV